MGLVLIRFSWLKKNQLPYACQERKESRIMLPGWGAPETLEAEASRASSTKGFLALVAEDF